MQTAAQMLQLIADFQADCERCQAKHKGSANWCEQLKTNRKHDSAELLGRIAQLITAAQELAPQFTHPQMMLGGEEIYLVPRSLGDALARALE